MHPQCDIHNLSFYLIFIVNFYFSLKGLKISLLNAGIGESFQWFGSLIWADISPVTFEDMLAWSMTDHEKLSILSFSGFCCPFTFVSDQIPPPLFLLQAWRPHQLLLQPLRQTSASGVGGNLSGPPVRRWAGEQDHRQQCQWDTSASAGVEERKP